MTGERQEEGVFACLVELGLHVLLSPLIAKKSQKSKIKIQKPKVDLFCRIGLFRVQGFEFLFLTFYFSYASASK
jgi:hypothetical protein